MIDWKSIRFGFQLILCKERKRDRDKRESLTGEIRRMIQLHGENARNAVVDVALELIAESAVATEKNESAP